MRNNSEEILLRIESSEGKDYAVGLNSYDWGKTGAF